MHIIMLDHLFKLKAFLYLYNKLNWLPYCLNTYFCEIFQAKFWNWWRCVSLKILNYTICELLTIHELVQFFRSHVSQLELNSAANLKSIKLNNTKNHIWISHVKIRSYMFVIWYKFRNCHQWFRITFTYHLTEFVCQILEASHLTQNKNSFILIYTRFNHISTWNDVKPCLLA